MNGPKLMVIGAALGIAMLLVASGPAQAIDSFFDVFTEVTVGPPYPTSPVEVMVSHEKIPGMPELGMTETEIIGLGLRSVMPVDMPMRMEASDSGGGGGGGAGITSFFDIFTELSTDDYPADSFFDLFVELRPPAIDKASPVLHKALAYPGDSFFDLFVEVDFPDSGGNALEKLHLHGEIAPGQPLTFSNVQIPVTADSFFDIFIEVSTDGMVIRESPLFTVTMTGTFVPEPATAVLMMLGGLLLVCRRIRVQTEE